MATSLNAGYTNNINVLQIRTSGSSMQRVTDRALTSPVALTHTVIDRVMEPDGGVHTDADVTQFTEGVS